MKLCIRLLGLVALLELFVCAWVVQQRLLRVDPVLPQLTLVDDPRLRQELAEMAAAVNGGGARAQRVLGEALLGHGFYSEAEIAFRAALADQPLDHASQFALALCLDRTGRTQECIPEYRRAAALRGNTSERASQSEHCRYAIGRAYLKLDDAEAAEAAFRENQAFAPAAYQLARLRLRTGKAAQAQPLIESHLSRNPLSLAFNDLQLRLCRLTGRTTEALAAADRLQRSHADLELNFNTEFIAPLNQRYGMNVEFQAYNRLLGTGDMDRIAAKLRQILGSLAGLRLPHRLHALQRLGETELQRGNPDAILETTSELRQLGVENADTLQLEGAAAALIGDRIHAAELWSRAAAMSPNVELQRRLAAYYAETGDEAAAKRCRAAAALLAAKMHFWSSDFQTACAHARHATESDPTEPQGWFYLGESLRELGQSAAAQAAYERCLEVNPYHGRAARRLAVESLRE